MIAAIFLNAFFMGYCLTSVAAGAGATACVNLGKEPLAPIQVYELYQQGATSPIPGLSSSVNNGLLPYNTQIAKIFVSALNQIITLKNQAFLSIISAAKAGDITGIKKAYENYIQQVGPVVNNAQNDLLKISLNLQQNWRPTLQFSEVSVIAQVFISLFQTNSQLFDRTLEYALQKIVNGFQTGTTYGQIVVNVEFAAASAFTNLLAAALSGLDKLDTATANILFLQNVGSGWNVIAAAVYIGVNVAAFSLGGIAYGFTAVLTIIRLGFIVILLLIQVLTMIAAIFLNAFFMGYCLTSVAAGAGAAGAGETAYVNLGKEPLAPIQVYELYQQGATSPIPGLSSSVNNGLLPYNTQIAKIVVSALNQLITLKNQAFLSIMSAAKARDVYGIEKAYADFIQQADSAVSNAQKNLLNISLNLQQNWKPTLQFNQVYVIARVLISVSLTNTQAFDRTLEYGLQNIVNGFQTGTTYGQIVVNVEFATASAFTNIIAAVLTGVDSLDVATANILFLQNVGSGWNVIAAAVYIGVNVAVSTLSAVINAFGLVLTTIKTGFIVILLLVQV